MCLLTITKKFERPKTMTFYKVFNCEDNKLYSEFFDTRRRRVYGKLYKVEGTKKLGTRTVRFGGEYKSGFHGFINLKDAMEWAGTWQVVVECKGRVHTLGLEGSSIHDSFNKKVCVSSTMTLIKKCDGNGI